VREGWGIVRPGQRRKPLSQPQRPANVGPADEWLTQEEVAWLVGRSPRTVRNWRSLKIGPPWHRPKGLHLPRYLRSEVDAWIRSGNG
jgi:hypothetical protein